MDKIPCESCPVLAVCVSKDTISCSILDKEVNRGFKSFDDIRRIRIFLKKDKSYRHGTGLELFNERYRR